MKRIYGGYYINNQYKFIFFTRGKCANTTLRKWYLHFTKNKFIKNIDKLRIITNKMMGNTDINQKHYNSYKKIIICRNPYDRTLSLFLDKFIKKEDKIYKKLTKKDINFIEFLELLLKSKKNKFKGLDGHFLPQIFNRKDIKFNYIIKIEENFNSNMNKMLRRITKNKKYIYNFNEKAYNFQSNYKENINNELINNENQNDELINNENHKLIQNIIHKIIDKIEDKNEIKINPNTRISELQKNKFFEKKKLLNKITKKLIYKIYKEDFDYFNYNK